MVSALWKACAEGDLEKVQALFNEPSTPDVEIKGMSILPIVFRDFLLHDFDFL